MLAKLSVKKPYTVIVGVILVIVLGVVSFMNMRTDLLPSIDLPYVIVYTTYIGASPEQVESSVTRPVESALASTTDLKSIQSVSNENVSMVILEYEDNANMDTALIEISSALNQVSGGWSDSIGTPVVMKINPDMMPVMIASVDYEGKDIYALSDYVDNTLMTDLEGINGVASVDASGMIEEQVTVTIRKSRIDAINNLILRDVDANLADVEKELDDAQAQLNDGRNQLSSAKRQALGQIDSMIEQLEAGQSSLPGTISELNNKRAELAAQRDQVKAGIEQLEAMGGKQPSAEELAMLEMMVGGLKQLEDAKARLEEQLKAVEAGEAPETVDPEALEAQRRTVQELTSAVAANERAIREQQAYIEDLLGIASGEEAAQLREDIAKNQEDNRKDESAIADNQTKIDEIQSAADARQARIVELDQLIAAAEGDTSALETERGNLKSENEKAEAEIGELTQANVSLRAEITRRDAEIAEKQQRLNDILENMPGEDEVKQKLESARELLSAAQAELAENGAALAAEQLKLAAMEAAAAGTSADALRQQIAAVDQQISEVKNSEAYQAYLAYQQMQQDPGAMERQLEELRGALSQLDAGIAQMDAMLEKLNQGVIPGGMIEGMDEDTNIADALEQLKAARGQAASMFGSAQGQLEDAARQLAEGRKEFEEARDDALEQANISGMISMQMVAQILGAQNMSMPAGYVSDDENEYMVRVGDKFHSIDELKNLVLFKMGLDSVDEIRLVDVATVEITDNSEDVFAIVNGSPAVTLSFSKQSTASTTEVSKRITKTFNKLENRDSKLHFTSLMDQGVYINLIIDSVLQSLVVGGVLAVIILAIFLADLRPTLIVACSIPLSVVAALVCMYFSNITLNIISLSGLSLAIGMLVDNSIVVIDNIYRLRNEEHMPILKACVTGVNQVAGALVSSTLTTICVWLPIVFVSGMVRQLFQDLALTIGYALIASLVVAMTLVPAMGSSLMKRPQRGKHRILHAVQNAYAGILRFCLRFKLPVLALAIGLLVYCVMQAMTMGLTLFPSMSSNQMTVSLAVDEEATDEEIHAACYELTDAFLKVDGVDTVGVMDGGSMLGGLTGGGSSNSKSLYVVLDDEEELTSKDVADDLIRAAADIGYEVSISESMMDMSALAGSGMSVRIKGAELETLSMIAEDVAKMMGEIEGTTEISSGAEKTVPQLSIMMDRDKAAEYNLTVGQVMQTVAMSVNTGSTVTQMNLKGKEMDVVVVEGENLERTPEDLGNLEIEVTTKDGKEKIRVKDICDISYTDSQQSIRRSDQRRTMTVSCGVDEDHNVALLGREMQEKLNAYELPEGYSFDVTGEDETINEMMVDMLQMIGLAIVMIVLIMVAQFQSFKSPFIVLFTIPLAFTGGLLALRLMNMELGITGMVGFLVLSGVVVNNGIVFVDSVNQMRAEGMEKREALVETGRIRLRPIMMTALTTILGMLPMAMATGMGSEMMQGMAVVTIGGLAYATLMTLFIVPILYDLLNGRKYKVRVIEDEE